MKNEKKSLADLNDQELRQEVKKRKSFLVANCLIIGMLFGVATYITVNKGVGFFTFFPFIFIPLSSFGWIYYKSAQKRIKINGIIKEN